MSQFVESLARLYLINKIDEKKLIELLTIQKINEQEYKYIISAKKVV